MARVKVCVLRGEATQSEAQVAACEREVARNRNSMMVTREFAELETEGVVGAAFRNRSKQAGKQASKSVGREDESATTRVSQASQRVVQQEGGRVSVSGTRVARRVQAGVAVGVCARSGNGPVVGRRTMAPRTATGAIATAVQEVK
jgi:hypothetical protein